MTNAIKHPAGHRLADRSRRAAAPIVTLGLTALVIAILPIASAAAPAVTMKAPYSGTPYLSSYTAKTGPGCVYTKASILHLAHFNLTTGKGSGSLYASAWECKTAWTSELRYAVEDIGMETNSFTAASNTVNTSVYATWHLSYTFTAYSVYQGGSATTDAYVEMYPYLVVTDTTTSTYSYGTPNFYNVSTIYDANGTVNYPVTHIPLSAGVPVSYVAGHTYVVAAYIYIIAYALVYGPLGGGNYASAGVNIPAGGVALNSIHH